MSRLYSTEEVLLELSISSSILAGLRRKLEIEPTTKGTTLSFFYSAEMMLALTQERSKVQKRSPSKRRCTECNEKGHTAKRCPVSGDEATCTKCNENKERSEFSLKDLQKGSGLCSWCRECRKNKKCSNRDHSSIHAMIRHNMVEINNSGKNVGVSMDYLLHVYEEQGGKCFYTGEALSLVKKGTKKTSPDRIDSELGYIKGNIALTSWKVNRMKSNIPYEEFLSLCKSIAEYSYVKERN